MRQELGRKPKREEDGERVGISMERIYDTLKITQSPISLSTPLGEGDDSTLGEFIEDQNSPNPDLCTCLLYTSPSPRDLSTSRMPSSA